MKEAQQIIKWSNIKRISNILFTTVDKEIGGRGTWPRHELWDYKKLNIYFLSVRMLTVNDKRNQIEYVHFAIFGDFLKLFFLSFTKVEVEIRIWYKFIYQELEIWQRLYIELLRQGGAVNIHQTGGNLKRISYFIHWWFN